MSQVSHGNQNKISNFADRKVIGYYGKYLFKRKIYDEKKQGESDRSKIQIDEDYKIKNNNYDKNRNIENSNI